MYFIKYLISEHILYIPLIDSIILRKVKIAYIKIIK